MRGKAREVTGRLRYNNVGTVAFLHIEEQLWYFCTAANSLALGSRSPTDE